MCRPSIWSATARSLIYGKDEQALEAANLLKDQLDVTVLIKPPVECRRRA